jgi:hypothetical protein
MNFVLLVVVVVWTTLLPVNECKRLHDSFFRALVDLFGDLEIIAAAPTTEAHWRQMEALNLTTPPECPLTTQYYSCDDDGLVDLLNITFPANNSKVLPLSWSRAMSLNRVVVENFVGDFGGLTLLQSRESISVRNAIINVETNGTQAFIFNAPTLFLTNVTIPFYRYNTSLNFPVNFTECRFVNVTLRCPVPPWLLPCFANSTVQPPCQSVEPPIVYPALPMCRGGSMYWCMFECPPPAVGFSCNLSSPSNLPFFPAQLGDSVFEITYLFIGEAQELVVTTKGSIGIVTRVELWNWHTFNWTLALDRPMPARRLMYYTMNDERLPMPPVLTNRVRVTVEQWLAPRDVIINIALIRSYWPMRAPKYTPLPENCGSVQILGPRSILDETVGDSLCIGRVCQFACTAHANNFTFDRAVNASYLVLQGGDVWSGGTLAAEAPVSDNTRVYVLPRERTKFVNVTGAGNVIRARLIGDPLDDEALPAVSVPPRFGLPGIFVKRARTRLADGAQLTRNGTSSFDGKTSSPPFAPDETTSVATTTSGDTFAFHGTNLWRFVAGEWRNVSSIELTRFKVNRGTSEPVRRLVAVDKSLLAIVSSSAHLFDGSSDQLLINRWLVQTQIDVFDFVANVSFVGLLRHDIALNISDIDVVRWNATQFAVVERATRAAVVFEFRAFGYDLVQCSANLNCTACLSNEANIEPCRWCDNARCGALCGSTESIVRNETSCPAEPTTLPAATTEATAATTMAVETTVAESTLAPTSVNSLPTSSASSSSTTIGLAVGLPIAFLAVIGAVGVVFWLRRRRAAESTNNNSTHMSTLGSSNNSNTYSDVGDVRTSGE